MNSNLENNLIAGLGSAIFRNNVIGDYLGTLRMVFGRKQNSNYIVFIMKFKI